MTHVLRAALAATVLALALAAVAWAASNSAVTIKSDTEGDGTLYGKTKSSKEACARFRLVKIFRDKPGGPKEFKLFDTSSSDETTMWQSGGPSGTGIPAGHYFARVTKADEGACDAAKSQTIKVEG